MPFDIKINDHMLSSRTCASVRSMMEDVLTKGTARNTFGAMGFSMAGKTGTATDIKYVHSSKTAEGEKDEPEEIVYLTCSFVCLFACYFDCSISAKRSVSFADTRFISSSRC